MKIYALLIMLLGGLVLAEPNSPTPKDPAIEIAELKATIEVRDKTIQVARRRIAKLKKQLAVKEKENRQLRILCKRAGVRIPRFLMEIPDIQPIEMVEKFERPLEIGQVGGIERATVIQVIDSNSALIEFVRVPAVYTAPTYLHSHGRMPRLISPAYQTTPAKNEVVWINGLDTKNLTTGTDINLNQVFSVIKTRTYPTAVGGTRTVFCLRPATKKEIESFANQKGDGTDSMRNNPLNKKNY